MTARARSLEAIAGDVNRSRIVTFGSANADIIFRLPTLPRPGETVLGQAPPPMPGGKGLNQAIAAARAGAQVAFAGAVGDDPHGEMLREALTQAGVDTAMLAHVAAPTAIACVMTDAEGRNQIAVASNANRQARAAAIPDAALRDAMLLLQMEVPPAENAALLRRAQALGARVILNLAPAAAQPELSAAAYIIANEEEAAWLAAQHATTPDAAALSAALGTTVIRTLGAAGAEAPGLRAAPFTVPVADTVGAGDAWCGAFAAALAEGAPLPAAMRFANAAGALACTRIGAAAPSRAQIEALSDRL